MRQIKILLVLLLLLTFTISGCGKKDVEDIVEDLEDTYNSLDSYKAIGTMKIQTGENPQVYSVEVWYKTPHYYRIVLNNVNTKVTQIVLRNDDGVFVLDPALNKSYRFQSDWPESNGAVYLFQSLAKSIIDDSERLFSEEEDSYIFEVKANYQNQMLTKQKVSLDKDLRPMQVLVFDPNQAQLVEMTYSDFDFDVSFEDDAFDMERNLTGWNLDSAQTVDTVESSNSFGFIEPSYIPEGVTKNTPKFVDQEEGKAVVIKYSGKYNYNLVESEPKPVPVSVIEMGSTEIVDLGFGLGIMTDMTDTRSLTWTYDGVEFKLSGDLPSTEMIEVAKSVFGQTGK